MCTVSYIPCRDYVLLTSNRDEKHYRSDAVPPMVYVREGLRLVYPRDGDAGGTWIAMDERGDAVIFLNGAFTAHQPEPPYRRSRGLILLDFFNSQSLVQSFMDLNLADIEPFTAVIRDDKRLFESRWDGREKHIVEKDASQPHIWSSVTLYSKETIKKRESWFSDWLQKHSDPLMNDILMFHQFSGEGDPANDLRMNRNGAVFTVSITSMVLQNDSGLMQYLDLRQGMQYMQELDFRNTHALS